MKLFWSGIAKVLFYVISGALLIYAASRSLDFITATLPPDQRIVGYLGLAATSGGMIAWLLLFLYSAEGIGQRVTSGIMTVLCMIGEFGLFTMDTLYQAGESGMTNKLTPDEIKLVVLALSALIAVNILATVLYHLMNPENIKRMRESSVRDQLEAKTLKEIEERGDELARKLAPQLASQWADEFENRFADMQSLGLGEKQKDSPASERPARINAPALTVTRCQKCKSSIYADGFCPTCEIYIDKIPAMGQGPQKEAAELQPVPLSIPFSGNGRGDHAQK